MAETLTDARILSRHRSYDADEVDAFLQKVRERVTLLEEKNRQAVDRAAATERTLVERDDEHSRLLGREVLGTQQALDRALIDARREADDIVADARARADRLLAAARALAERPSPPDDTESSGENPFADLRRTLAQGGGGDQDANDPTDATDRPTDAQCQLCGGDDVEQAGICTSCGGLPDRSPLGTEAGPAPIEHPTARRRVPVRAGGVSSFFGRRR